MADSSVVSNFNFRSFKIDQLSLEMKQHLAVLELQPAAGHQWEMKLNIRPPTYFSKSKVYVVGVDCLLTLHPQGVTIAEDNAVLKLEVGAAGSFAVVGEDFKKEVAESLVKIQMPALVFAHVRAAVTNILASSGYGSMLLPLINVHKLAEQNATVEISVVEE